MKILALIPPSQSRSPVRYYRGEGVLERLLGVEVDYLTEPPDWFGWLRLAKDHRVMYVMRSAQMDHVEMCRDAKDAGIKIWYDLDDDYTAVNPDNTAFTVFARPEVQQAFTWFLKNSDLVTFSTNVLYEKFSKARAGNLSALIPNCLDDTLLKEPPPAHDRPGTVISWRGGGSHFHDLQAFDHNIQSFAQKRPEFQIFFLGFFPFWLADSKMEQGQVKYGEYIHGYWQYMRFFRYAVHPWVNFVPLRDNQFNRAKSCIAALEAVWAGAVPVVPDFEEWQIPGALRYTTPDAMETLLHMAAGLSIEDHQKRVEEMFQWIKDNRRLSTWNSVRLQLLGDISDD